MGKKKDLVEQVKIVISKLKTDFPDEINSGVIRLIYKRYKNALEMLEGDKDINQINIIGGVRAYLDGYSDYNNSILGELYKAEKMNKELLSK